VTTVAWTFPVSQSNTTDFRAWVTDFVSRLGEVGLVQTADTGQIDIATATLPATTNTAAGYQVWKFSDNTIFLKFEYGTAGTTDKIGLFCTVGTGSDGAGTLTGTVSSRRNASLNVGLSSPGTARLSFMSHSVADGFFGFNLYVSSGTGEGSNATLIVARSADPNGTPNAQGVTVYWRDFNNNSIGYARVQALNFLTGIAQTVSSDGSYGFVPHGITNTSVGVDQQAFVHFTAFPQAYPVMQVATVSAVEFPVGATFSATLVGATPKNYICLDTRMYGTSVAAENFRVAMLWE
jgi:hypothetical protein